MKKYIYALGFFDGVHLGHQALLKAAEARSDNCGVGVVTFSSHPDTLVLGQTPVLINTLSDRLRLLGRFGVAHVVTLPFDRQMLNTPWQDFLEALIRDYGAAGFVCGDDFRFGAGGRGTGEALARFCRERGLPCCVVPEQTVSGQRVSSTCIRQLLEAGAVEQAAEFLGHPHILTGPVIHGRQLGRTLGIPTANLALPEGVVVPRFGVYACWARVDGGCWRAVTNVGTRPTVHGSGITVEPWLLDYDGDLYGREITLEFHAFLRPERKFDTLAALKEEILKNAAQTRTLLK